MSIKPFKNTYSKKTTNEYNIRSPLKVSLLLPSRFIFLLYLRYTCISKHLSVSFNLSRCLKMDIPTTSRI